MSFETFLGRVYFYSQSLLCDLIEVDLPILVDGVGKVWVRTRLNWFWLIQGSSKICPLPR